MAFVHSKRRSFTCRATISMFQLWKEVCLSYSARNGSTRWPSVCSGGMGHMHEVATSGALLLGAKHWRLLQTQLSCSCHAYLIFGKLLHRDSNRARSPFLRFLSGVTSSCKQCVWSEKGIIFGPHWVPKH